MGGNTRTPTWILTRTKIFFFNNSPLQRNEWQATSASASTIGLSLVDGGRLRARRGGSRFFFFWGCFFSKGVTFFFQGTQGVYIRCGALRLARKMPTLAYCATLNNYTPDDVAILRTPNSKLHYIIVGHEVGSEGTRHLQIYFQLACQAKLTTIKNWGGPWARMHLEGAKGTDEEAATYCKKEGNFFEIGERKKMGRKGARSDLDGVKNDIQSGLSYIEICSKHFETAAKYGRFIREQIQERDGQVAKDLLRKDLESLSLKPWQQQLLNVVMENPHPRAIHWIWSSKGETGKSTMATYLGVLHGATVLELGKGADLKHIWAKLPSRIAIFDLTRKTEGMLDGLYSMAEQLKNGRLVTTKYDGAPIYFPIPHVVFFANFLPNEECWSKDRYVIKCVD